MDHQSRSQEEDEDDYEYTDENTITFKERKAKYGRRTQVEVLLGFVVHLLMLFYWVFVHVYDSTVVKSLSEDARRIAFPFYGQLLGRWRFLTYINLVSIRMFSAIKVVICVYNILGLFCTLAWHQAQ